jgi:hypothetical protein
VERSTALRTDEDWLAKAWAEPATRVLVRPRHGRRVRDGIRVPVAGRDGTSLRRQQAVDDISNLTRFGASRWTDVMAEVVAPLIRNMRDVRRYCLSAQGTLRALESDIELVDVLALEAVRVFLPDVYARLANACDALTKTGFGAGSPELKAQIEQLSTLVASIEV